MTRATRNSTIPRRAERDLGIMDGMKQAEKSPSSRPSEPAQAGEREQGSLATCAVHRRFVARGPGSRRAWRGSPGTTG